MSETMTANRHKINGPVADTVLMFASRELHKDRERLQRLLNATNILPWESRDGDRRFTYIGEQAADLLGYSPDEWTAEGFWAKHIHPADLERVNAEFLRGPQLGDHFSSEYRMTAKCGREVWVEDIVDISKTFGFLIDITDDKDAEFALAELGGRLITAQEEERKRIARELHDDLNQRIALLSIELEQLTQKSDVVSAARLVPIQSRLAEISTEVHRMSYELHPSKLDHLGLAPALRTFCKDLSRSRGIKVDFKSTPIAPELPRDITLCVFRVAQEAVHNAAKYSSAAEVKVRLVVTSHCLELEVSDNGGGFDTNSEKSTKGLGITSMHERVRLVSGDFSIVSAPRRGTTVRVTIPLDRDCEEIDVARDIPISDVTLNNHHQLFSNHHQKKGDPNETHKDHTRRRSHTTG